MNKPHFVVYRHIVDPQGIKIVGVLHSKAAAENLVDTLAEREAAEANEHRKKHFEMGLMCNARYTAKDFAFRYEIAEAPR